MTVTLHVGDCREALAGMSDAAVDSIVTDPPYELGFMGKSWDSSGIAYDAAMWAECLRVLKPGGHLLAFGGTRTYHRMTVAIEDAGFEIRDSIHWIYGSGFPKSLDVSKAIDKANGKHDRDLTPFGAYVRERRQLRGWSLRQLDDVMGTNTAASWWEGRKAGVQPPGRDVYRRLKVTLGMDDRFDELIEWCEAQREIIGERDVPVGHAFAGSTYGGDSSSQVVDITAPATPEAAAWSGWGTALKPAHEPIVVARKPLVGTVAANVLAHGTGALNIDGCRVGMSDDDPRREWQAKYGGRTYADYGGNEVYGEYVSQTSAGNPAGRWPANIVFDEAAAAELDAQSGITTSPTSTGRGAGGQHGITNPRGAQGKVWAPGDTGGASRFFYCAKAGAKERPVGPDGTKHATVKPLSLMRWLVRLVTPPGGTVLDPFAGSGTTLEAAILEGFDSVGIERDPAHADLCAIRVERSGGQWAVPRDWAA